MTDCNNSAIAITLRHGDIQLICFADLLTTLMTVADERNIKAF